MQLNKIAVSFRHLVLLSIHKLFVHTGLSIIPRWQHLLRVHLPGRRGEAGGWGGGQRAHGRWGRRRCRTVDGGARRVPRAQAEAPPPPAR